MSEKNVDSAFQTKTVIRERLDAIGASPKKRFGQCFLIDRNLMNRLLDSAAIDPTDCILEVGVGTGSLTGLLAQRAGRVVAIEVDSDVFSVASEHLSTYDNIRLVHTDALAGKSTLAPPLVDAVKQARAELGGALKLVANLPYDIATPLVVNLLLADLGISRMCFTVQTEVADRFLAAPSTHDYGPVTILTRLLAEGRRVCKLPPQAFWPAPKVHSSMVQLDLRDRTAVPVADLHAFSTFIRLFFNHRRKTLAHTAKAEGIADRFLPALADRNIEPAARPENVSPDDWAALFAACR